MTGFNLLINFIEDLESLIKKSKKNKEASTFQLETNQSGGSPIPVSEAMAEKTLHEFSAPNANNIHTGPMVNTGDATFELKPALINMVRARQFCGKTHEDASAHLQHFLEICSTFTIKGVTQDAMLLCLFPFSLLGKVKQWFYAKKTTSTLGQSAPMHSYQSCFQWAKPMLCAKEFEASNSKVMKQFLRHGNIFKNTFQNVFIMGWRIGCSCKLSTMGCVGGRYQHIYTTNIIPKRRKTYIHTHIYLCY
jgi:hypothetical protein